MKKSTLVLSAVALSLGMALSPMSASAAETASAVTSQQLPSLAPMLEKVMPSVVSINVEGSATVNNNGRMPQQFQQFFGDNSPFCQDGSPFSGSPMCQGAAQMAHLKRNLKPWAQVSLLMQPKVMLLRITTW